MSTALTHASNNQIKAADGDTALEPNDRRLRIYFGGDVVVDTIESVYLFERDHLPVYYIPRADVRSRFLVPSETTTVCPRKGTATYWDLVVGEHRVADAVWTYPESLPEALDLSGYVAFYWDRVDAWYEEDEQIFVHPRDPYVRVDVLQSSRHVEVYIGETLVAETSVPKILFETSLPPRYYIPRIDVRGELFTESDTRTQCPYKGTASYLSYRATSDTPTSDIPISDIAWYYPQTTAEATGIEDHLSFYSERGARIVVDGVVRD